MPRCDADLFANIVISGFCRAEEQEEGQFNSNFSYALFLDLPPPQKKTDLADSFAWTVPCRPLIRPSSFRQGKLSNQRKRPLGAANGGSLQCRPPSWQSGLTGKSAPLVLTWQNVEKLSRVSHQICPSHLIFTKSFERIFLVFGPHKLRSQKLVSLCPRRFWT